MTNPFQVLANPQQALNSQLQAQMQQMMGQTPQAFKKMQEMVSGKSDSEMKQTCMNLAKERGIDLAKFASQFGIKI